MLAEDERIEKSVEFGVGVEILQLVRDYAATPTSKCVSSGANQAPEYVSSYRYNRAFYRYIQYYALPPHVHASKDLAGYYFS